jgi:hypothetical protein
MKLASLIALLFSLAPRLCAQSQLAAITNDAQKVDFFAMPRQGVVGNNWQTTNSPNSLWFSSDGQLAFTGGSNNMYFTNMSGFASAGVPLPPPFPAVYCQGQHFYNRIDASQLTVLCYDVAIFPGRGTPGIIRPPHALTNFSTVIEFAVVGANVGTNFFNGNDHDMWSIEYDQTGLTGCLTQLKYYTNTLGMVFRQESTQGTGTNEVTTRSQDVSITPSNAPAWFFASNHVDMGVQEMWLQLYNSNSVAVGAQHSTATTTNQGNTSVVKFDYLLASEQTFPDASFIICAGIWIHDDTVPVTWAAANPVGDDGLVGFREPSESNPWWKVEFIGRDLGPEREPVSIIAGAVATRASPLVERAKRWYDFYNHYE